MATHADTSCARQFQAMKGLGSCDSMSAQPAFDIAVVQYERDHLNSVSLLAKLPAQLHSTN